MRRQNRMLRRPPLLLILTLKFQSISVRIEIVFMKTKLFAIGCAVLIAPALPLNATPPAISGDYLEVRSCDVYTGPCFANAEMGLAGKEGILVWSVKQGQWNDVDLSGLKVIAVVSTDQTLGDQTYQPRSGKAVLIVDERATAVQRTALASFARSISDGLIREVAAVESADIQTTLGTCAKNGCASVTAGDLVNITTRCLGGQDHLCGNEEVYYPPLIPVDGAMPAYTEIASFQGEGLNKTWQSTGQRSSFLARFAR